MSKDHNSAQNHQTRTKFQLDLIKQQNKYQINIFKHEEKKFGKLICRTDR